MDTAFKFMNFIGHLLVIHSIFCTATDGLVKISEWQLTEKGVALDTLLVNYGEG